MSVIVKLPPTYLEAEKFLTQYGFEVIKNHPTNYLVASDVNADAIKLPCGIICPVKCNYTHNRFEDKEHTIKYPQIILVTSSYFRGDYKEELNRWALLPKGTVFPNTHLMHKKVFDEYVTSIYEGTGHE